MLDIVSYKNDPIPFIHYCLRDERHRKPIMILLYHGWGSSTQNMNFLASTLARWGYSVITPEILYHDSRNPLENHFQRDIQECYFWKTIIESVPEVIKLSNHLKEKFHGYKHILFGSSMGGMITTSAFIDHRDFDGLISLNGSGDWRSCENYFQKIGFRPTELMGELNELDPISRVRELDDRPVLLMHGTQDHIIPSSTQEAFFKKAIQQYENPEKIHLELYPNVNHATTLGMIEQAISWLDRAIPQFYQQV